MRIKRESAPAPSNPPPTHSLSMAERVRKIKEALTEHVLETTSFENFLQEERRLQPHAPLFYLTLSLLSQMYLPSPGCQCRTHVEEEEDMP